MRKGFTLIELVMVIVIIGILAVVAMPKFFDLRTQAKQAATKGALGALRSALAMYYANELAQNNDGSYPNSDALLAGCMSNGAVPNNASAGDLTAVSFVNAVPAATVANMGWIVCTVTSGAGAGNAWAADNITW